MILFLAWPSSEQSGRLTEFEVEELFKFTSQLTDLGRLSSGKYIGATRALYWQRLKQGE